MKSLYPTDGAAGAVALILCQLPATHQLAALWHWVEIPAPEVWPDDPGIWECRGEVTPTHPFYELPMADTVSFSVGSLSAKDFKHCIAQHSNTSKVAQSYQLLVRLRWAPKSPSG